METLDAVLPIAESRHHPRAPYAGVVFISWKTFDGQRNHVLGRSMDVSERGLALALGIRIPVGSFVKVQAEALKLNGSATVRRVAHLPGGYLLGLELSASLDPDVLAEFGVAQSQAATAFA